MIGTSVASENSGFSKIFPVLPAKRLFDDGSSVSGSLTIKLTADSVFLLAFTSSSGDKKEHVSCDIDDVVFPTESPGAESLKPLVQIDTPKRLVSISLDLATDVSFVKELIDACQEIFSLSLRMNILLRDCFYSGIDMSSVSGAAIHPETVISASARVLDSVESLSVLQPKSNSKSSNAAATKSKSPMIVSNIGPPLKCFFCLEVAKRPGDPNFPVHPYVTHDHKGAKVHMCARCVATWKKYRDEAIKNNRLFDGEPNEELCALCSALPEELILCASCPRSYCSVCLSLVIGHEEFKNMKQQDDWSCMMCSYSKRSKKSIERFQTSSGSSSSSSAPAAAPSPSAVASSSSAATGRSSKSEPTSRYQNVPERAIPQQVANLGLGRERKRRRGSPDAEDATPVDISPVSTSKSGNAPTASSPPPSTQASSSYRDLSPSPLPPVDSEHDELYYFGQYISVIKQTTNLFDTTRSVPRDLLCRPALLAAPKSAPATDDLKLVQAILFRSAPPCCNIMMGTESEDFCTLCKDGGDLIECDFEHKIFDDRMLLDDDDGSGVGSIKTMPRKGGHHKNFVKRKCRKVYHNYCLGYEVNVDKWYCPRHFCAVCGSNSPIIECTLCSISLCIQCAGPWSQQLPLGSNKDRYLLLGRSSEYHGPSNFPAAPNTAHLLIACPSCTENLRKCILRNEVDGMDFHVLQKSSGRSFKQDLTAGVSAGDPRNNPAPEKPQARLPMHHGVQPPQPPNQLQASQQLQLVQSSLPRSKKHLVPPSHRHSHPQMLPRIELITRQSVPQVSASLPINISVATHTNSAGKMLLLKWNIDDVAIMAEAIENADKSLTKDQLIALLLETEPTKTHLFNYSHDMILRKVDQFLEHPEMLGAMRRLRESCKQRVVAPPSSERPQTPITLSFQLSATSSGPGIRNLGQVSATNDSLNPAFGPTKLV